MPGPLLPVGGDDPDAGLALIGVIEPLGCLPGEEGVHGAAVVELIIADVAHGIAEFVGQEAPTQVDHLHRAQGNGLLELRLSAQNAAGVDLNVDGAIGLLPNVIREFLTGDLQGRAGVDHQRQLDGLRLHGLPVRLG